MSLIKPRTRGKRLVRHITHLDHQNHETLCAYAAFIGEDTAYVMNELVDTVLAKDREFVKWRAVHPDSCVPHGMRKGRRRTATAPIMTRPVPNNGSNEDLSMSSPM